MSLLEKEMYRSFLFFIEEANHNLNSSGFGLIRDNTKNKRMASIASVGFGLSAYVIGVENKYITYEEGKNLVINTFKTFLSNKNVFNGFYQHFLDINTNESYNKCEFSTIDTVIFFNGAITCDSYFDEEEVHKLFMELYNKLDFLPFVKEYKNNLVFRMAYNPFDGGDYRQGSDDPWIFQWHMYAEQLSMYFLAASTDNITSELAKKLYNGFERKFAKFKETEYVYCPTNALFVYQYSHAWIDFRNIVDEEGFDWFKNSVTATLNNRDYCIKRSNDYPILNKNAWGVTACITPKGYRNQCIEPSDINDKDEQMHGVLPPCGAIGSIVFSPDYVMDVLKELEEKHMDAFREYGFTDGITYIGNQKWICDDYIGINKGITLLMIDNYLNGTTWKYYMKHDLIKKAIDKLGFRRK